MENINITKSKDAEDLKDIADAVKKNKALQSQIKEPTRNGMINALMDAKFTAGAEIQQMEYSQGDTIPMLWDDFSNQDLYRKLSQYQAGLQQHCIKKIGKNAFEKLLKEAEK